MSMTTTQPSPSDPVPLRLEHQPSRPSNLPRFLTSFIGREQEARALQTLLARDDVRLVTLIGPGGVGKTRLAQEAIADSRAYADGVWFVALSAVRDPSLVAPTIATTLGLSQSGPTPAEALIASFFQKKQALLVLDNFEHVLDVATLVADLLKACPDLKAVVISRSNLRVTGEHVFEVPPLGLPGDEMRGDLARIEACESVRLFVDRARARSSTFTLTSHNANAVTGICRRLDGLPLAIELAAARVGILTPSALEARLTDRLVLLTDGPRDLPERQQTIRSTIAWSYDLLAPDVQRFYRRMAVFVGGFTLDGAERAGGLEGHPDLDTLTAIGTLVDNNLLRTMAGFGGDPRYVMLETIRAFGLEQLAVSGERDSALQQHAEWCLALARLAPTVPVLNEQQDEAMQTVERQDADLGNLRAALSWLDASGQTDALVDLVMHLRMLWFFGNHDHEGLKWYRRVLELTSGESSPRRVDLLTLGGQFTLNLDNEEADHLLTEALELARRIGDPNREAHAMLFVGVAAEERGDYDTAKSLYLAARQLCERTGDTWFVVLADWNVGILTYARGELSDSLATLKRAAAAAESLGDRMIPNWCIGYFALIACEQGRPERAAALLAPHFSPDASGWRQLRPMRLATVAVVAAIIEADAPAARLFGASEAASQGYPLPILERRKFERFAASVRDRLGADAYDTAWQAGSRMVDADVSDEVHGVLTRAEHRHDTSSRTETAHPMTDRELEVLRFLVDGHSNREIAATLSLSERTVENHVQHILNKLGLDSRTAAATYAMRHDLI